MRWLKVVGDSLNAIASHPEFKKIEESTLKLQNSLESSELVKKGMESTRGLQKSLESSELVRQGLESTSKLQNTLASSKLMQKGLRHQQPEITSGEIKEKYDKSHNAIEGAKNVLKESQIKGIIPPSPPVIPIEPDLQEINEGNISPPFFLNEPINSPVVIPEIFTVEAAAHPSSTPVQNIVPISQEIKQQLINALTHYVKLRRAKNSDDVQDSIFRKRELTILRVNNIQTLITKIAEAEDLNVIKDHVDKARQSNDEFSNNHKKTHCSYRQKREKGMSVVASLFGRSWCLSQADNALEKCLDLIKDVEQKKNKP